MVKNSKPNEAVYALQRGSKEIVLFDKDFSKILQSE